MNIQLQTRRVSVPLFRFVPAEWSDIFVYEKIPMWYARIIKRPDQKTPPYMMGEEIFGDDMDDLLAFQQESCYRNLHHNYPEDFGPEWAKWSEEQMEEADENFCADAHYMDAILLEDMQAAFDHLRLAYIEDDSYGMFRKNPFWKARNNPIVEVW